jgi:hypothetical protein
MSTSNNTILPQNPWTVESGLYLRTDGQVIHLSGPSHFWDKKHTIVAQQGSSEKGGSASGDTKKESAECIVGSSGWRGA